MKEGLPDHQLGAKPWVARVEWSGVVLFLLVALLGGCGGEGPDEEVTAETYLDSLITEPMTAVIFQVVDSATGGFLTVDQMEVTTDILFPLTFSLLEQKEVPTDQSIQVIRHVSDDSLVVGVRVSAEGYGESEPHTLVAARGEQKEFRIALSRTSAVSEGRRSSSASTPESSPRRTQVEVEEPERRPPTTASRPPVADPVPTYSQVVFETTPSGARVRVFEPGSRTPVREVTSPSVVRLPVGVYSWQIELVGFEPESSGAGELDLRDTERLTVRRALTRLPVTPPAGDEVTPPASPPPAVPSESPVRSAPVSMTGLVGGSAELRAEADLAFDAGRCQEAIGLYVAIPEPSQAGGPDALVYAESRLRLGQCYQNQREFENAIDAFEETLRFSPGQWYAKYLLGRLFCEIQAFDEGFQELRELEGSGLGKVDAERKGSVQALARYGSALCYYKDLDGREHPERFPDLIRTAFIAFEEFIVRSEDLARKGAVPRDLQALLSSALADARRKREELRNK